MRTPWCSSYFSLMPRRMLIVSSTDGSPTNTGWNRRARAASFSTCLRYSSSVVAPMQCSVPRASSGLIRLDASIAPSARPAPTSVCISSMNRTISPCADSISFSTAFSRSSNSPRYFAPATMAPRSSDSRRLFFSASGTSPLTMRSARPSTMAVLPTPGSPISTGLFLVRRASTWMARRISSSRPITGSSLPSRASAVTSRAYFFSASNVGFGVGWIHLAALADVGHRLLQRLRVGPALAQRPRRRRVGRSQRHQQPVLRHVFVAGLVAACCAASSTRTRSGVMLRLAGAGALHLRLAGDLGLDRGSAPPSGRRRRCGSARPRRLPHHPAAPSAGAAA